MKAGFNNAAMHYGEHQDPHDFDWLDREGYIETSRWGEWTRYEWYDGSAVIGTDAGWWGYGIHYSYLKVESVIKAVAASEEDGLSPPPAFAIVDCIPDLDERHVEGILAAGYPVDMKLIMGAFASL